MARNNGRNGAVGTTSKDEYVLQHTPTILAAMMIRRQSTNGNEMVDQAVSVCSRIWDVVHEMDVPAEAMMSQPVDATVRKAANGA
jgi:hypothetical protein